MKPFKAVWTGLDSRWTRNGSTYEVFKIDPAPKYGSEMWHFYGEDGEDMAAARSFIRIEKPKAPLHTAAIKVLKEFRTFIDDEHANHPGVEGIDACITVLEHEQTKAKNKLR